MMKKIAVFFALALIAAVSCQKEIAPAEENPNNPVEGKLTATIVATKVTYTETSEMNLQPAWEVGDEIIGFDDSGNTYTLTVASVSAETATLSGTVPDGALHLIYKSGAKASDISSKSLAIDYTAQKGDKTMPAVMLADGTVEDGACDFSFTNAGAIIGISAVKRVPSGSTISKITVEGENLSAASVALNGSALALTAATVASDAITTAALSGVTVTDANGTLNKTIFIAVPANAKIAKVSAFVAKEPETMKKPSATPQEGVDYVTIGGVKWAKWNVGASSEMDYGWYFPWAGTEGYVRTNFFPKTWQSAKATFIEFSYSPSSVHTATASDYLYVNTQTFTPIGHLFNWENTPYHIGTQSNSGWTKYIPSDDYHSQYWSGTGEADNKAVLDPEDDAARAHWGGNWRTPTHAEWLALKAATYWAWDSTDQGCYVYAPNPATDAGKIDSNGTGTYSKSNALLFFPAAGYAKDSAIELDTAYGFYMTSSLYNGREASYLRFSNNVIHPNYQDSRGYGFPVRPVSD